jgi:hypothetical protein
VARLGISCPLWCQAALLLCAVQILAGCSGQNAGRPKVVPVTGAVAYNGRPIEGASVIFWVEGSPRPASGTTDAKGEFRLSTFAIDDGCVPGTAKILVIKEPLRKEPVVNSSSPPDPLALARLAQESVGNRAVEKPLIPLKYASERTTPLQETVSATGENRFVLQLKD